MPIYNLTLNKRYQVANNTFVFEFEKPSEFTFLPGQYGGFTLIDPPFRDKGGITRRFSILSSPQDPYLSMITRIQESAYKRSLSVLTPGSQVKFAGPSGSFLLHEEKTIPAVFIAGGIGIAPFYSMLRHAWQQSALQPLYLFYGNRSLADTAFYDEFIQAQQVQNHFHFIPVFEQPPPNWQGECGYITPTILRNHLIDYLNPIYYVCGSPKMVTVIQEIILEIGVPPEHIKIEDFPGY